MEAEVSSRGFLRVAFAAIPLFAVSTLGADEPSLAMPKAREAAEIVQRYVEARNAHELSRASAMTAPDVRWLDEEGRNHPKNDAHLAAILSWEGVMGAAWECRVLGYADGWLEVEITERNRMYDALDIGSVIQRDRIRVVDGRIREGRTLATWTTGREEDEATSDFRSWVETLSSAERRGLIQDGHFVFDAAGGHKMRPLLDRWEREHPPARRLLKAALEALGGQERVAALDNWIVEGRGRENLSAELQGLSSDTPTWRPHEERIGVVRATGAVAWERKTPRNDESLRWRRFIQTPTAFGVVDWTSGYGVMQRDNVPEPARAALMRRIPHLLLLDAAANAKRLITRPGRLLAGAWHDVVEATLADDARLTLVLGRNPSTLDRVEYDVYLPGLGDSTVAWQWKGWHESRSLGLAPSGHTILVHGAVFQDVDYSRYEAPSKDAQAMMEIPTDLKGRSQGAPVPAAGPATGEVAPGVHVTKTRGFLTAFVELADFVVVFDAPASPVTLETIPAGGRAECELASEELGALIARTCPSKPVRFVIVSHHHSDHLGGLRAFAGPGVTILAAPGHVPAVRRAVTAPHTLAPDLWRADGRYALVEAVADRRVIEDAGRTLEVWNTGENPHSRENLLAWLPQEHLLLQGDLFYYEEGSPFPLPGRETMDRFFARWLAEHRLEPRVIYGVHYAGAAGAEALARALR